MNIEKGKLTRAQRVVIYGPEGVGKSTLAAGLPAPLFLDTEEGTQHMDVDRVHIDSYETMRATLREAYADAKNGKLPYKTLVIDTGDRLWDMCAQQVIDLHNASKPDKIDSLVGVGYGKGYSQASELFIGLLSMFDACRRVGLHIAVVCHCRVERVTPPDSEAYTMYTIKINAPASQAVTAKEKLREWGDVVLFCNYVTSVTPDGKAKGGVNRKIYTEHRATWEAKNRIGLPPEIDMTPEALEPIFAGAPVQPPKSAPATVSTPAPASGQEPAANSPADLGFVAPTDDDETLLTAFFRARGSITETQTLNDLPPNVKAALVAKREAALEKAREWQESLSN